jgi:peptidoglycan hydrolase-like protein with peptidoglycan-binding domain
MSRQTRQYVYDFRGHLGIPLTASGAGTPWVKADTSSSGSPTVGGLLGGGLRMLLESTSEVQNLCLYFGDVLAFDIDEIIRAWFIMKTVATLDSTTQIAFGLAGNRNDAIDSIAQAALFRCIGDNDVVVESDDGTNDNDDVASGLTLAATWKRFEINFAERITTQEPPSLSLGRKSNVGFYGANDNGSLRRVASGTRFDMSNYTGGLQPFLQIQKTADVNVDNLDVLEVGIEVNLPQYS